MKKVSLITGIILTAAVASYSFHLSASPHRSGGHGFSHDGQRQGMTVKRVMQHLSHLNLSEQQKVDIRALVEDGIEAAKGKRQQMKALHLRMKEQRNSGSVDEQAIRSISREIAEVKSDLMILHLNKRKQVSELLTGEQRVKMAEMKAERRSAR